MDRLDCDRMFIAVYETGSFSLAARRLGVSSGQASKLVSRLETELGVQLLSRTTRALSPTEVGQAYYERMRTLIAEFDALDDSVRSASGEASGRLVLTAPNSFGVKQLMPALIDFAAAYPRIRLDVSFADRHVNLLDEGFDAAVRVGAPDDSSYIARKICPMRVVAVASADYIARVGEPSEPEDLSGHECVIDTNRRDANLWRFLAADGSERRVQVEGRLRFSNGEACLAAAEAGHGVAFAPTFLAGPRIRDGALKVLLRAYEPERAGVFALYPASRHLAAKVRALIEFLAVRFRGVPPWDQGW
jgi:DNA-binding transcriptional LysR family regulator